MIGLKAAALAAAMCSVIPLARAVPTMTTMQVVCMDAQEAAANLKKYYGETPIWRGLSALGALLAIYQSKDGTWTAVLVQANGVGCAVAAGTDGEISEPERDTGSDA